MDWGAVAIVVATLGGPIAAVQVQKYLEAYRERQRARETIFRVLMATRASRTSTEHVQALNGIELSFIAARYKPVEEAWNAYRDLLHAPQSPDPNANQPLYQRRDDAFWDLLHAMSKSLGYPFDRTHIKNGAYSPIAHGDLQRDQDLIRSNLVKVLSGQAAIPMIVYPAPTQASPPPAAGHAKNQR